MAFAHMRKVPKSCSDLEGRTGVDPLKNLGFLSNTGTDPLKSTKLASQHSMLGHHRHASETPFKWRFTGGPMMARLQWYFDPPSPLIKKLKNLSKLGPL